MNVNMNTSAALAQNTGTDVGVAVLKKAMSVEAQGALSLINAIPQPQQQTATNLPPNLGKNINVTA